MVVGDDQIYAQLLCAAGFLHSGNAVVHRHHQRVSLFCQSLEYIGIQAISPAFPAGQFTANLRPLVGQTLKQDGRCRDAVHIVVAKNDDGLAFFHRTLDAFHRLVHVLEQKGIGQFIPTIQKVMRGFGRMDPACRQHTAEQHAEAFGVQGFGVLIGSLIQLP